MGANTEFQIKIVALFRSHGSVNQEEEYMKDKGTAYKMRTHNLSMWTDREGKPSRNA